MMFAMTSEDFEKALYKDFTRVQRYLRSGFGQRIHASCPNCDRIIVDHAVVEATEEENAEVMLEAYEHKRTCPPWRNRVG